MKKLNVKDISMKNINMKNIDMKNIDMKKINIKEVDIAKWFKNNTKKAEKIVDNKEAIENIINKVGELKFENEGPVDGFINNVLELKSLLIDWKNKEYTDVSKSTIVTITLGLMYLISPVNLLTEWLPFGLVDDVIVIRLVFGQINTDILKYRKWKANKNVLKNKG